MFIARYDLRAPAGGPASRADLFRAALDQAAWCEQHHFDMVVLSEHHGVDDGYLPSPLVLATAMAARTSSLPIMTAVLVLPLYEPVRLAEDMVVLDIISSGRVSHVLAVGYRPEEYEQLGVDWSRRGEIMEEHLTTLLRAWTGEPFEHAGRRVRVTPRPLSDPHPLLMYGGGSTAAARRAARFGLGFFPQHADPELADVYRDELDRHGHDGGFVMTPPDRTGTYLCADDPDRFWAEHGEHLLHEARSYTSWQQGSRSAVLDTSRTVEEMREAGIYRVCTPDELVAEVRAAGDGATVTSHPLIGGLPPEVGWRNLELLAEQVMPAVRG
ncbi:MAG: LLM class flavin-dependent oxidoreductase [Actinobacteria bacterium]|nr:LLM class flavin-dependent oxidoreductase [Actinomycetota bacterium]